MVLDILKKRAFKNDFFEIAGKFYLANDSDLIKRLQQKNNSEVYFGIHNESGVYTVIGERYIFFGRAGIDKKIANTEFLGKAKKGMREQGKNRKYEYLQVGENDSVWVYNIQMLCVIVHLTLFLTRTDGYGIFPAPQSQNNKK